MKTDETLIRREKPLPDRKTGMYCLWTNTLVHEGRFKTDAELRNKPRINGSSHNPPRTAHQVELLFDSLLIDYHPEPR